MTYNTPVLKFNIFIVTLICMIIAGQLVNGFRQLITHDGQRVHSKAKPKKLYLGVPFDDFSAKRLWVDEVLSDAQKYLFLKNAFSKIVYYSIDYEVIDRDNGRELLHAYALHHKIFDKKITAIETVLHGLGRALFKMYDIKKNCQCFCVYDTYLVLSVHCDQHIYFFVKEPFVDKCGLIYAARRAQERYYATDPIDIERCFFINFTDKKALDIHNELDFDASFTVINEKSDELIAYGLACRGITDD